MAFSNKLLLFLSILLLVLSSIFAIWLVWPQPKVEKKFLIPEVDFFNSNANSLDNTSYTLPEGILARLIIPERVRLGEEYTVDLFLEPMYEPDYYPSDLLNRHNLIAETRIDWPLIEMSPDAAIRQPFELTHRIHFQWKIMPHETGQFEGKFWFYLVLVSIQDALTDRQALLSAPITTDVISLLNMTEWQIQMSTFCMLFFSCLLYASFLFGVKNKRSR